MKKVQNGRKYSRDEIELISKSAIGKTLGEIKKTSLFSFCEKEGKGSFGQLIENYLFGISNNIDSEPDFVDAGIELKVTPYKRIKDGKLSAKERLVLNVIDYNTEYKNEFKTSHFWYKNNKLQILWYLWEESKDKMNFVITNEKLLDLSISQDLKQIDDDWNTIIKKIRDGHAEDISEADTMYLGACTKGNDSNALRSQPKSDKKAMQRAFCFKVSYMTQLVRKYIGNYSDVEKLIKDNKKSFISNINYTIKPFIGMTQEELMKYFNVDTTAKNLNNILISRMFDIKKSINETEEFKKANIVAKTIRIEESGKIKESLSFPPFKYVDIVNQTWETSDLKENLETTKYMFFVFKNENGKYLFKGIKLWNMPETVISNEVKLLWMDTFFKIKSGKIVKSIDNGIRRTYFMGKSDNEYCHLRPHALNSQDTVPLPVPDLLTGATEYTKYCFWINNSYLEKILSDFI